MRFQAKPSHADDQPIFAEGHFTLGNQWLDDGRLDEAEAAYRRAAILLPALAEAHCNLGRVLQRKERIEEAIVAYRRAFHLRPDLVAAPLSLGTLLLSRACHEEGAAVLHAVLRRHPDNIDALCNLATAMLSLRRSDEAERLYQTALALEPDQTHALFNLGTIRQGARSFAEAEALYRRTLRLNPSFTRAQFNLGAIHGERGQFDEAVAIYSAIIEREPESPDIHYNLGVLYQERGMMDQAVQSFDEAVRHKPKHLEAHFNLGAVYQTQKRFGEAMTLYRHILDQNPDHPGVRVNMATVLLDQGQVSDAVATYTEALAHGSMPEAHWNLSLARLLQGDYPAGWEEYEWRWQTKQYGSDTRVLAAPLWTGENGNGRHLFLHAEQGLGDTLQFCRYVPLVQARGWRVTLEVQAPLHGLIAQAFPEATVVTRSEADPPPHDAHCPLLSLPRVFGTTLDTIPARVPYLRGDPARAARARERLGAGTELNVGLVWAGNPAHTNDANRSIPAARLRPLLETPGVRFFGLQKEPRPGERETIASWGLAFTDLGPELGDFADTMALLEALDLLVTVDTSVAHLAGALARPVWMMLPYVPDWRWLMGREDSPWYPTVRLFRRALDGDWDPVLRRVGAALTAAARPPSRDAG